MICPVQQPKQVFIVRKTAAILVFAASAGLTALPSFATGLATCDSGPKSSWQAVETLEKQLKEKGWTIRRIKEDGGCYEVYALNEKGERVEAYFHPVTLAPVPTKPR
ncbi:MAG: PepSY domain-containing protein [Proteobacteria bacterium]|nr:PepSY domain-containing protein [Pseudomonadota bacterium]